MSRWLRAAPASIAKQIFRGSLGSRTAERVADVTCGRRETRNEKWFLRGLYVYVVGDVRS